MADDLKSGFPIIASIQFATTPSSLYPGATTATSLLGIGKHKYQKRQLRKCTEQSAKKMMEASKH
jgi:hypothetical protein